MMTLDLNLLRNFLVIVRAQSISIAAQQVGRTQSALSMQVKRLEADVGARLLHRGGAGIQLTKMGERLLLHAEALLAQHDEILMDMTGSGLRGSISLGCPEDYSIAFLPGLVRDFFRQWPQLELHLVCAPTSELRPLLRSGQIDLALVSVADPNAIGVIREESFAWVANEPMPAIVSEFEVLPLALSAPRNMDHQAARDALDAIGRRYRIAHASNSFAGLIAIARSGHAISVVTRTAVPNDLFEIIDGFPTLPSIGIVVEFANRQTSPAAMALAEHVRKVLPTMDRR